MSGLLRKLFQDGTGNRGAPTARQVLKQFFKDIFLVVTDVGAANSKLAAPIVFLARALLAASRLLLGNLFLRRQFLAPHSAKLAQFSVQAMPQRAFGPEFFQKGLSPGKCLFVDLLIAEKSSPRPLNFIFGKQSITS